MSSTYETNKVNLYCGYEIHSHLIELYDNKGYVPSVSEVAQDIKDYVEPTYLYPALEKADYLVGDLLRGALASIDWRELAELYLPDVIDELEEDWQI